MPWCCASGQGWGRWWARGREVQSFEVAVHRVEVRLALGYGELVVAALLVQRQPPLEDRGRMVTQPGPVAPRPLPMANLGSEQRE